MQRIYRGLTYHFLSRSRLCCRMFSRWTSPFSTAYSYPHQRCSFLLYDCHSSHCRIVCADVLHGMTSATALASVTRPEWVGSHRQFKLPGSPKARDITKVGVKMSFGVVLWREKKLVINMTTGKGRIFPSATYENPGLGRAGFVRGFVWVVTSRRTCILLLSCHLLAPGHI